MPVGGERTQNSFSDDVHIVHIDIADFVFRQALNMDQVDELQPPPNPAKTIDTHYQAYIAEFGSLSWELDAIEPRRLAEIVRDAILSLGDGVLWDEAVAREKDMRHYRRH